MNRHTLLLLLERAERKLASCDQTEIDKTRRFIWALEGLLISHTNPPEKRQWSSANWFLGENGNRVLISELCPDESIQPTLLRISIKQARYATQESTKFFIIQWRYYGTSKEKDELLLISFEKMECYSSPREL